MFVLFNACGMWNWGYWQSTRVPPTNQASMQNQALALWAILADESRAPPYPWTDAIVGIAIRPDQLRRLKCSVPVARNLIARVVLWSVHISEWIKLKAASCIGSRPISPRSTHFHHGKTIKEGAGKSSCPFTVTRCIGVVVWLVLSIY